jgi:4-hydroxybenzoate polyprenyltransferase
MGVCHAAVLGVVLGVGVLMGVLGFGKEPYITILTSMTLYVMSFYDRERKRQRNAKDR